MRELGWKGPSADPLSAGAGESRRIMLCYPDSWTGRLAIARSLGRAPFTRLPLALTLCRRLVLQSYAVCVRPRVATDAVTDVAMNVHLPLLARLCCLPRRAALRGSPDHIHIPASITRAPVSDSSDLREDLREEGRSADGTDGDSFADCRHCEARLSLLDKHARDGGSCVLNPHTGSPG